MRILGLAAWLDTRREAWLERWSASRVRGALGALSWVALGVAFLAAVAGTHQNAARLASTQHADYLYLPALWQDLTSGGRLSDWSLTPSPYLFPDLLLYAAAHVVGSSHDWRAIAGGLLVVGPTALIAAALVSRVATPTAGAVTVALFAWGTLALALGWNDAALSLLILSNHGGQALVTLLCLWLLLEPTAGRVATVAGLSFLTSLSDPLFVMGACPAMVLMLVGRRGGPRQALAGVALFALACGAGIALRALLPVPEEVHHLISAAHVRAGWTTFRAHLWDMDAMLATVGLGAGLLALVRGWREPRRRLVTAALWLMLVGTVTGLWLIGAEVAGWSSRYLTSAHVALVMLTALGFQAPVRERALGVVAVSGTLAACLVGLGDVRAGLENVGRMRLAPLDCFDGFAATHEVHRCVATYALAKPVALLSRSPVQVVQIRDDGQPDFWINTRRFTADGTLVDCAILQESETDGFTARFGAPDVDAQCEGASILWYSGERRAQLNQRLQPLLQRPMERPKRW